MFKKEEDKKKKNTRKQQTAPMVVITDLLCVVKTNLEIWRKELESKPFHSRKTRRKPNLSCETLGNPWRGAGGWGLSGRAVAEPKQMWDKTPVPRLAQGC